jgi:NADH-quinone oxidoreductase subunit E
MRWGFERSGKQGTRSQMEDKVKLIIDRYGRNRDQLVSILQEVQAEYNYLPREELSRVSELMGLPVSEVYQVATFFKAFSLKPRGKHLISCCLGTACHVRNEERIVEKLERVLKVKRGGTTRDRKFTLEAVNCLGACALGPVIKIDDTYYGEMDTRKIDQVLARYQRKRGPH